LPAKPRSWGLAIFAKRISRLRPDVGFDGKLTPETDRSVSSRRGNFFIGDDPRIFARPVRPSGPASSPRVRRGSNPTRSVSIFEAACPSSLDSDGKAWGVFAACRPRRRRRTKWRQSDDSGVVRHTPHESRSGPRKWQRAGEKSGGGCPGGGPAAGFGGPGEKCGWAAKSYGPFAPAAIVMAPTTARTTTPSRFSFGPCVSNRPFLGAKAPRGLHIGRTKGPLALFEPHRPPRASPFGIADIAIGHIRNSCRAEMRRENSRPNAGLRVWIASGTNVGLNAIGPGPEGDGDRFAGPFVVSNRENPGGMGRILDGSSPGCSAPGRSLAGHDEWRTGRAGSISGMLLNGPRTPAPKNVVPQADESNWPEIGRPRATIPW